MIPDSSNTHSLMVDSNQKTYTFESVSNDLLDVQMYTLKNGLRIFMSSNTQQPRIFTNIAVHAGSKLDPPETTGLAHYMEHMLFKGTSKIGSTDWEQEKALLQKISDLYETYRNTTDEDDRKKIYAEIDQTSNAAAQLVAPNEYDKLASAIGANQTNAYTWLDQTVYVNDIPTNELERWMELESERFRMMALRLFHTELETVYEEFNINQDRDFRKVNQKIRKHLFPKHPYGTQTTIGDPEHLRSPSQVNIQRYFSTYYVPNNMAIVLAGQFDPNEAVALAERYFGNYKYQEIAPFQHDVQPEIKSPIVEEVMGQEAPYVSLAWRFGSSQTDDPLYLSFIQHLLYNQQAGLLDLNLNQQQQVLSSEAWSWFYEDYSVFGLYGKAREGQDLEEVKDLLLEQVEKLKTGDFDEWLLEACIKDFELGDLRSSEANQARVGAITQSFVLGISWERFAHRIEWMKQLTKADIQAYAKKHLNNNHIIVYKRQGEDKNIIKVEKPPITPVSLNREAESEYASAFLTKESPRLQASFLDFSKSIQQDSLGDQLQLDYVYNPVHPIFQLNYIFEMGKNSDRLLALAMQYLPYLGTDKYSPSELQQEFFKLGLSFDVHSNAERSYVTLEGLPGSFEAGVKLFEHILSSVRPNAAALKNVVTDILTKRAHAKQDKGTILSKALGNYARYGTDSPFTWRISEAQLLQLDPKELVDKIKSLTQYEHRVYYYGQEPKEKIAALLKKYHLVPPKLKGVLKPQTFNQLDTPAKVIFLDFPIVQTDVLMVSKGTPQFNLEEYLMTEVYNNYFGYGLSSIVFQEIREAKALAYSTYAYYTSPTRKDKAHYLQAYVGTQPDKLPDALPALLDIIENMPVVEANIRNTQESILKRLESERINPYQLYWKARSAEMLGFNRNLRKDIYEAVEQMQVKDLLQFQQEYVKNRAFTFVVLGNKERVDLGYLAQFGPLEEVSMEQIFGY